MTEFDIPQIVCAPMAGGPSTVELAASVCDAGGLGFLAAGYRSAEAVAEQVEQLRARTDRPFGVNVFVVRRGEVDQRALDEYVQSLARVARGFGVEPGVAEYDDDGFDAKIELLLESRVPVVSFTFGCPSTGVIRKLQAAGSQVWITVATTHDAAIAIASGCDALVVQGAEAGGHRAAFEDDGGVDALDTVSLLREVATLTDLSLIATGGIATVAHTRRALDAGAVAVQVGTSFLLTPEAGTHPVHRAAIASDRTTAFTRAFSGRTARGIANGFMRAHPDAPRAYPQIHHATTPLRAAARAVGDWEHVNLWAGTHHGLAEAMPAAHVVRSLTVD